MLGIKIVPNYKIQIEKSAKLDIADAYDCYDKVSNKLSNLFWSMQRKPLII